MQLLVWRYNKSMPLQKLGKVQSTNLGIMYFFLVSSIFNPQSCRSMQKNKVEGGTVLKYYRVNSYLSGFGAFSANKSLCIFILSGLYSKCIIGSASHDGLAMLQLKHLASSGFSSQMCSIHIAQQTSCKSLLWKSGIKSNSKEQVTKRKAVLSKKFQQEGLPTIS